MFQSAVDASSASEDDLDSDDSEQDSKSCSHCGATSKHVRFLSGRYFMPGKASVAFSRETVCLTRLQGVAPGWKREPAAVRAMPNV